MAPKERFAVRYYLVAPDGLWRIPNRLVKDLVGHKAHLPQYAATKQEIIEVVVKPGTRQIGDLAARGVHFAFDANGYLDQTAAIEVTSQIVGGAMPIAPGILDLRPALTRRSTRSRIWTPTADLVRLITKDLRVGPRLVGSSPPIRRLRSGRRYTDKNR
jgi:hypothetical protein